QQHKIGIIYVDYLQLMKPPPADNREQEVAQISRAFKMLARELNIPVVALSQLSRAIEKRGGEEKIPQLADLRDSGAIEQDADVVMFIQRKAAYMKPLEDGEKPSPDQEEEMNTAEIYVRKHRNGPQGMIKLFFHKEYATFENLGSSDEYDLIGNGDYQRASETPF
ncbi:MAG: DnaB-like helicase C-terminal domain-containing protein, partial [bacterium]